MLDSSISPNRDNIVRRVGFSSLVCTVLWLLQTSQRSSLYSGQHQRSDAPNLQKCSGLSFITMAEQLEKIHHRQRDKFVPLDLSSLKRQGVARCCQEQHSLRTHSRFPLSHSNSIWRMNNRFSLVPIHFYKVHPYLYSTAPCQSLWRRCIDSETTQKIARYFKHKHDFKQLFGLASSQIVNLILPFQISMSLADLLRMKTYSFHRLIRWHRFRLA